MSDKLKVAVNTRLLLKHRMEGIARFIYETSKRMVKSHPEVEFHFLFDRPFDPSFIFEENVKGHVLSPQSRHPLLWYWWFEYSVYRFLEGNDMDAFFSGDMYLCLRTRVPTLYVSHDLNYLYYPDAVKRSHLKYMQRYFPRFHERADHIIAVSEFTRNDIVRQYGIDASRITVAYNDVPAGFRPFKEEEKQEIRKRFTHGNPFFIYVGSLHPRKNLERLLKAFDAFVERENSAMQLVIYGRKAFKTGGIFKTFKALSHRDQICFVDQSACAVPDILPAAEALLYPSLFEGFGIPILEAFHSGVPVVTSSVTSMPEVAGDAALLVNPEKIEEISAALTEVLKEDVRIRLLEKARLQKGRYSWDRSAEIIWTALSGLLNEAD